MAKPAKANETASDAAQNPRPLSNHGGRMVTQRFQRPRGEPELQWRRPWPFNVGGWRWPDWPPRVNGPRKYPRAPAPPAAASPGCLSELHVGLPWPNGLATPVANSSRLPVQRRTLRQFHVIQCAGRPVKSDLRRVRSDNISSPLLPWLIGSYGHAPPALWPSACVVQRVIPFPTNNR